MFTSAGGFKTKHFQLFLLFLQSIFKIFRIKDDLSGRANWTAVQSLRSNFPPSNRAFDRTQKIFSRRPVSRSLLTVKQEHRNASFSCVLLRSRSPIMQVNTAKQSALRWTGRRQRKAQHTANGKWKSVKWFHWNRAKDPTLTNGAIWLLKSAESSQKLGFRWSGERRKAFQIKKAFSEKVFRFSSCNRTTNYWSSRSL